MGTRRKQTSRLKRKETSPDYCEIPGCGYSRFVQRHRIVPGREQGKYILGNVISLCPTHHSECDTGLYTREFLLNVIQERIAQSEQQAEDIPDIARGTG